MPLLYERSARCALLLAFSLAAIIAPRSTHAADADADPKFTIADLGSLGGSGTIVTGLDDAGEAVGYSQTVNNQAWHAFIWSPGKVAGTMRDLGTLGGVNSWATAINDHGDIVVASEVTGQQKYQSFICKHGSGMAGLPIKDFVFAIGINTRGSILVSPGASLIPKSQHLQTAAGPVDLGKLNPTCVNNLDEIAGADLGGGVHAAIFVNGNTQAIAITGGGSGAATAITDSGFVGGWCMVQRSPQAFLMRTKAVQGTPADEHALLLGDATAQITSINSDGQCVGDRPISGGFFCDGIKGWDLQTRLVANKGWQIDRAVAINHTQQIVGVGWMNNSYRSFLLTQAKTGDVTAPSTVAAAKLLLPIDPQMDSGYFHARWLADRVVIIGPNSFCSYNPATGQPLSPPNSFGDPSPHKHEQMSGFVEPHGKVLLTLGGQGLELVIWDLLANKQKTKLTSTTGFKDADTTADGSRIVTCPGFTPGGNNLQAILWDAATGNPIGSPMKPKGQIMHVHFSPDGRRIMTTGTDTIQIWDGLTGRPIGSSIDAGAFASLYDATFDPTGRQVASIVDGSIMVSDAESGRMLWRTSIFPLRGGSITYSPNGKLIAVTGVLSVRKGYVLSEDATIVLDALKGKQLMGPLRHDGSSGGLGGPGAEFSPDSQLLITHGSYGRTSRVWDMTRGGLPLVEPQVHPASVTAASFDATSTRFVTVSSDGSVRLWQLTKDVGPHK